MKLGNSFKNLSLIPKKTYPILFFSLVFLVCLGNGSASENRNGPIGNNSPAERYYTSSLIEGFIGMSEHSPFDNPSDNVFTVNIETLPLENEEVWLTYELYGISNFTGISRSINDQLSTGGYYATQSNSWQIQKEQLKNNWIKKGDNIIRFTLPEKAAYNYRIRNLGIHINKTGKSGGSIIINQPISKEYINDQGYINGFVEGRNSEQAVIFVDGKRVDNYSSEFEALIPRNSQKDVWNATIKVIYPDGEIIEKKVTFSKPIQASYYNEIAEKPLKNEIGHYLPDEDFQLQLDQASISIGKYALESPEDISIIPLRDIDLPAMDPGLVNVTKNHNGYRFLPHGTQFNYDAIISLQYDPDKLPDGYTEEDIRTYYFDEGTKHWVALKRKGTDGTSNQIRSYTSHFTDMINGILIVPESPETYGFIPTSTKNLTLADPATAVNTIEPPQVTNMGTANLVYPIILPVGRQGIQPDLSIQYGSDGDNGWLGLGWNLQLSSITVETRWGVPRYLEDEESETYILNGEQLWPLAHRGELVSRTSEKRFYPRVEGVFSKIIRHGDDPSNYWWEVTDKSGVRYSYGGTVNEGITGSSVLTDSEGNIAHWALTEIRDLNDNFVKYEYQKQQDYGVRNGKVEGYNIYIKNITYTGHGNDPGKYKVVFTRDRDLNEEPRKDITITGLYGFKKVTADLLRKIEIFFKDQTVRSYELIYKEGAFFKTLLNKITEYDASGNEFTHHEFEYYNDVNSGGEYEPYLNETYWENEADNIAGNDENLELVNKISMLGAGRSVGGGAGMSVTVGPFDGNLITKGQTAGSRVGFNSYRNDGVLAFVDINGDGLDDKIFKGRNNSRLYFRPNTSDKEGNISFGDPVQIIGISDFNIGWSTSGSTGIEATFVAHIAAENSLTTDVTNTYFADVNGDKLIDVVKKGTVYFNHIVDGVPTFTKSSSSTPSPIYTSGNIDPDIVEPPDQEEIDKTIDQNPLHDVVKIWEAPYKGSINIDAPVALLEPVENSITESEDGVKVSIQHKGTVLWSKTIPPDDFTETIPTGISSIAVNSGDRIYFRVQSINNGSNDQVLWKPIISYSEHSPDLKDANELPIYQFNAYDDFLISAQTYTGMPLDGTINIEGTFSKPKTSDDIQLEIVKETYGKIEVSTFEVTESPSLAENCIIGLNGTEYKVATVRGTLGEVAIKLNTGINKIPGYSSTVSGNKVTVISYSPKDEIDASFSAFLAIGMKVKVTTTAQGANGITQIIHRQDFDWEDAYTDLDVSINELSVNEMDKLYFRLKADSKIAWPEIKWAPRVYYTSSADPDVEQVIDDNGNPFLEFSPVIEHQMYNKSISPTGIWSAEKADTIMVSLDLPNSIILNSDDPGADFAEKDVIFTIKKSDELVYKETRSVTFHQIPFGVIRGISVEFPEDFSTVKLLVGENDQLFFDLQLKNTKVAQALKSTEADISIHNNVATTGVGIHTYRGGDPIFGSMYRGWGQFAYNGNRERADKPIDEKELKFDDSWSNTNEVNLDGSEDPEEIMNKYNSTGGSDQSKTIFIYMYPVVEDQLYMGFDDLTYVKKDIISSSRMGRDDIEPVTPLTDGSIGDIEESGARAIRKVNVTVNSSIQAGIQPIVPNLGYGASNQLYDYMDMNGDTYPDIVSPIRIQYTLPTGELDSKSTLQANLLETTVHGTLGLNGGGELIRSNRFTATETGAGAKSKKDNDSHGNRASKTAVKVAAAGTLGITGSVNIDATGFAFMDINNDGLPDKVSATGMVALNLGYKFSLPESWGFVGINSGQTLNLGGGLAINIGYGSIEAGVGISKSWNAPRFDLLDVNGDGLLDRVIDADAVLLLDNNGNPLEIEAIEDLNLALFQDLKIFKDFQLPEVSEFINNLVVRINTGNSFSEPMVWKGAKKIRGDETLGSSVNGAFTACIPIFVPPDPIPVAEVCFNPDADASIAFSKSAYQISDIDGDGFPDILESDKENELKIKRSSIGRTNLLKEVRRPLGASFVLDYKQAGNTYDLPMNIWTLAQVKLYDGFDGDGVDTTLTRFVYEEGVYNRNEREFYGFGTVRTNQYDTQEGEELYRSIVQEFKNDNYYEKGLMSRMVVQDSSENLFDETLNTYELRDILTGEAQTNYNNDDGASFPALIETKEQFYEGEATAQKSIRMDFDYDLFGNVISYTDFGDSGNDDDFITSIGYHSVPSSYIMDVPKSTQVAGNGNTYRKRSSEIDESTGKITQIKKQLENGDEAIFDMKYDDFGNLVKITHPENSRDERFFYEYQYDPEVQTYILSTSDAYGYNSTAEYDYRFGKLLLNNDQNGQQVRYEIDDLGRTTTITGPFELAKSLPYTIAFDYDTDADVPWARAKHYDQQHPGNDMEIVTFIDGLKRTIEIKKDASIFKSKTDKDEEQMIVSGTTKYDAFGREIENYYPVTEPKGSETIKNTDADAINPANTAYDILDRITKTIDPDGTVTTTDYGFGKDRDGNIQYRLKYTDGNGNVKETFKNVRRLTTSLKVEYSQEKDVWTSYHYNAINELEEVIDDQDNQIKIKYDWFGRRTEIEHPDAGLNKFDFDLADNLIKKTTANLVKKGKAIKYKYDFERLTAIIYPENAQNNVSYTYGNAGDDHNGAGRIVLQEDATGAQEFSYNPLGAVSKNLRTIVIPHKGELTYKTKWEYDTWGRVTEMTYPDNEKVTYTYNLGGNLSGMKGKKGPKVYNYLDRLGYNKFEKVVFKGYGNGTETFYKYFPDDFTLLESLVTKTHDNRIIMDNKYTYDDADNILRIHNEAENKRHNLMGGESDYRYEYDDMYRLTKATGRYEQATQVNKYELDMEYNSIHNIIKKNQIHQFKTLNKKEWNTRKKTTYNYNYEYEEEQPHAAVRIGAQAITYDANGNQTGSAYDKHGQVRKIRWDEENRIMAIADNGAIFSYVYDADNQRVLKSNGGGQMVSINGSFKAGKGSIGNYTVYVNPYVVVRNKMVTKHYYANDQRIVTKLADSNEGLLQTKAGEGTKKSINYQQKQAQLKGSVIKAYSDLGIEIADWDTNNPTQLKSGSPVRENHNNDNANATVKGNGEDKEAFIYYYHPDHLGSSTYITDADGEVTQHLEYFAFGETFMEEHSNTQRTPYLYNAKELDDETGLYYYGARYYDGRNNVWQSVDPLILGGYLGSQSQKGVFNPVNLAVYSYVGQNPVNYTDYEGTQINPPSIYRGSGITATMTDFFERESGNNKPYSFDKLKNRDFWSGGPEAMKAARIHAEANNSITLEMTIEGQQLEKLTEIVGFDITEHIWKQLSKGYASGATGSVHITRAEVLRPDNILENQEIPILLRIHKNINQISVQFIKRH